MSPTTDTHADLEAARGFWEGRVAVEGPRATRFHGGHDDFDFPALRALIAGRAPRSSTSAAGPASWPTSCTRPPTRRSTRSTTSRTSWRRPRDSPRLTTAVGDVRTYADGRQYDLILLLGVITYIYDAAERADLYARCFAMLKPGGTLFVKAQMGVEEEVRVDTDSDALGSRYSAIYPHLGTEAQLLARQGFAAVDVRDPYPAAFSKYDNTHFHHLVATR